MMAGDEFGRSEEDERAEEGAELVLLGVGEEGGGDEGLKDVDRGVGGG